MELKNLILNCLMKQGNKQVAQKILQNTLLEIQLKTNQNGWLLITKALQQCNPYFKLRPIKKSGITRFNVIPLTTNEQERLSVQWLINSAIHSKGRTLSQKLARQILLVATGNENAEVIKRIKAFYRLAETSRY
jgi:small subunit ribosomal protein S7